MKQNFRNEVIFPITIRTSETLNYASFFSFLFRLLLNQNEFTSANNFKICEHPYYIKFCSALFVREMRLSLHGKQLDVSDMNNRFVVENKNVFFYRSALRTSVLLNTLSESIMGLRKISASGNITHATLCNVKQRKTSAVSNYLLCFS